MPVARRPLPATRGLLPVGRYQLPAASFGNRKSETGRRWRVAGSRRRATGNWFLPGFHAVPPLAKTVLNAELIEHPRHHEIHKVADLLRPPVESRGRG